MGRHNMLGMCLSVSDHLCLEGREEREKEREEREKREILKCRWEMQTKGLGKGEKWMKGIFNSSWLVTGCCYFN